MKVIKNKLKPFLKAKYIIVASLVFVSFFIVSAIFFVSMSQHNPLPLENTVKAVIPTEIPIELPGIVRVIDREIIDAAGTYGIVVKHLETGESYKLNEHEQIPAASLYKLWVMNVAFEQIENGSLSPDEEIEREVVELNIENNIATESAEKKDGKVKYTVAEAIRQMIINSDNYATYVLADRIGLVNVQQFLREQQFADSSIAVPPTTSAYDIARFYELLYRGTLHSNQNTDAMLELLKEQQINYKLPKYLPENTIIAHKTGELGSAMHDAGIVYTGNGAYIIVVLSDSDNPDAAAEKIAKISQAVYNYFTDTYAVEDTFNQYKFVDEDV